MPKKGFLGIADNYCTTVKCAALRSEVLVQRELLLGLLGWIMFLLVVIMSVVVYRAARNVPRRRGLFLAIGSFLAIVAAAVARLSDQIGHEVRSIRFYVVLVVLGVVLGIVGEIGNSRTKRQIKGNQDSRKEQAEDHDLLNH